MREITPENAVDYLLDRGWLPRGMAARVEPLAWGVSNIVLRVYPESGPDFVVKQSREKLRVAADWRSRLDRIHREMDALAVLDQLLPAGSVPKILHEDRADFAFAMEALPADHRVWKPVLLGGEADPAVAEECGRLLGAVHALSAGRGDLAAKFGDRTVFDELRLDPFYRFTAAKFPEARAGFDDLIARTLCYSTTLVLGDFSPKNVLLVGDRVALVDFETIHYGDPAFDLGFFLSHLILKALARRERFAEYAFLTYRFLDCYRKERKRLRTPAGAALAALAWKELFPRLTSSLAGCLWARIDGKSTVDYLPEEPAREGVRRVCRRLLKETPADWEQALAWVRGEAIATGWMR
jgi:5-methylthioribose kinase